MIRPQSVTRAAWTWSVAVAAGVGESTLAVTELALRDQLGGDVWTQVAVRVVVYSAAGLLVVAPAHGRRWARWLLAGLLSVVGLASLVVPSLQLVLAGVPWPDAVGGGGPLSVPFLVVRTVHVAAVLIATVLMFSPSANRYFRASRRGASVAAVATDGA